MAGRPEPYFFSKVQRRRARQWGSGDVGDYAHRVIARTSTPNGAFGMKMMFTYLEQVVQDLREAAAAPDAGDADVLEGYFPGLQYVWLYRDDVVAQGVSWAKARMTDEWAVRTANGEPCGAEFDFHLIHRHVWRASRMQVLIRRWLAWHNIRPILVRYEDLAADPDAVARDLLARLGITPPRRSMATTLQRQADSRSDAWAARYRRLARTLPPGLPSLTDPLPRER